jgi:predicted DNA-binding transcriptional regulator YafY
VEPHALVALGRRWYLLAWDRQRGAWRTFRVDRIASPASAGGRVPQRTVPGGDAAAYVQRTLASVSYRYEARVRFLAPANELRARLAPGWGELRDLGDGTCLYVTSDDDLDWLAMRVAFARTDFELDGPPELLERLSRLGERLRRAAGAAALGAT